MSFYFISRRQPLVVLFEVFEDEKIKKEVSVNEYSLVTM